MAVQSFQDLVLEVDGLRQQVFAVAGAADPSVLRAVAEAETAGLGVAVLFGPPDAIADAAATAEVRLDRHQVVPATTLADAILGAVAAVASGDASVLVKGLVPTRSLLREVLSERWGLHGGGRMSHIGLFELPQFDRPLIVTDAGMNIAPTLEEKGAILLNAVRALRRLGYERPRAAILAAEESVNPRLPGAVDAAALAKMAERGAFGACAVEGPLPLDAAISRDAAERKGLRGEVPGRADILLAPDINSGNILYKALMCLGGAGVAASVLGARAPIAVPSRADSAESRFRSIALACRLTGED